MSIAFFRRQAYAHLQRQEGDVRLGQLLITFTAAVSAAAATPTFLIGFDTGFQNGEAVLGYFAGGFGSLDSGPGPDFGVTFSPGMIAFEQFPHYWQGRVEAPVIMNLETPLSSVFSFYHENADAATVTLYDGIDGTGNSLFTFVLEPSLGPFPRCGIRRGNAIGRLQAGRERSARP